VFSSYLKPFFPLVFGSIKTFSFQHYITIEREKSICLASGGNSSWTVWVACISNLDVRLYHATKFTVLAEINIKQCVSQKLAGLDELIKLHKLSCLKITCLYVCKDTLWIGTSAGIILNVKIPHVNNTTNKLNAALSFYGNNLRFIVFLLLFFKNNDSFLKL
jgi:hypothetical protein